MSLPPFASDAPRISAHAEVDATARIIGAVEVGAGTRIDAFTVIRGDLQQIHIGSHCHIQDHCVLHVSPATADDQPGYPIEIGDHVSVGHGSTLHGCHIVGPALIGIGCVVMDGALLPPGVILTAGSHIPPGRHLSANSLWDGSPAVKIRDLDALTIAKLMERAALSAAKKP